MARKGWDSLSEGYRRRLERAGITRSAYDSGSALQQARGHTSRADESFASRVRRFVESYPTPERLSLRQTEFPIPLADRETQLARLRAMGPVKAQEYMDQRRRMNALYMSGRYEEAKTLYLHRDKSVPDGMWWYHGIFGG